MESKQSTDSKKISEEPYSELKGLPPSFFELNRKNYLKNLRIRFAHLENDSVIILQSPSESPRYDGDVNYFYYDSESNFYYLTGVRLPDMYFVLDVKSGESTLFYNPPDEENKIWMKIPTAQEIEDKYGITTYLQGSFNQFLQRRNMKTIYVIDGINENSGTPCYTASLNFVGEYAYLADKINHDKYIYMVLCDTRRIKNEEEKKLLKYISKISNEAHMALMKYMKPGLNERDTENYFLQYLRDKYYTRFYAYNCICASGSNSATLHYDLNNQDMRSGDLYLTDMGIRFCVYCSDITTTFPVNGKFTEQQKKIYDIVLESNRKVIASIVPGVTKYKEMDVLSKIVILEGLQKIGILKDNVDSTELFNNGVAAIFMPHSVSHLLGLDVHDVGRNGITYKSLNILENGMYVTVEPGIYFIDFLMDRAETDPIISNYINKEELEKYRGFGGVRIEDDVMVNEENVESYNLELPRTTQEIEEFMASP